MTEEEAPKNEEEAAVEAPAAPEGEEDDGNGTVIRDTDIVFDCPHCGHNLAIDYRGAGLQITCVNCGESVLVPIPSGMKIDDLDLEPGELLKQLFATRRNLQKSEAMVVALTEQVESMAARQSMLESRLAAVAQKGEELRQLCLLQESVNAKLSQFAEGLAASGTPPAPPAPAPEAEAGTETPEAE